MKFQRYLNIPKGWNMDRDYFHQSLPMNTDEARLNIGNGIIEKISNACFDFPDRLLIRTKLKPIKITGGNEISRKLTVQLGEKLTNPYILYGYNIDGKEADKQSDLKINSCYRGFEFYFEKIVGENKTFHEMDVFFKNFPCVARRNFCVQEQDVSIHISENNDENKFLISSLGLLVNNPVFPYGVYYREGSCLSDIEQVVFTADVLKWQESNINLKKIGEWVSYGISTDGTINSKGCFVQDMREHLVNLELWFNMGKATLNIPIGVLEDGTTVFETYKSCSIRQENLGLRTFEITFNKMEV